MYAILWHSFINLSIFSYCIVIKTKGLKSREALHAIMAMTIDQKADELAQQLNGQKGKLVLVHNAAEPHAEPALFAIGSAEVVKGGDVFLGGRCVRADPMVAVLNQERGRLYVLNGGKLVPDDYAWGRNFFIGQDGLVITGRAIIRQELQNQGYSGQLPI